MLSPRHSVDPDPRTRHTIWSVVFGNYFFWLASCSANQAMVQRCLSLPNIRKANMYVIHKIRNSRNSHNFNWTLYLQNYFLFRAIGILAIGIIVIVALCCFTGLVIYATYYQCDPIITKVISSSVLIKLQLLFHTIEINRTYT